jgi:nucleoside-triphosphatase THEP1
MELSLPGDGIPFFDLPTEKGTIHVVTGWRGVGKTTLCHNAVKMFRWSGLKVSGILSPGRFENRTKNGIFAVDLETNETRLAGSTLAGEIDGFHFGRWYFDSSVLQWGNQLLKNIVETDILVIDEIGFFEFDLNTGWMDCFKALDAKNYRMALAVIRPECIDSFSRMGYQFLSHEVTDPNPQPH